MSRVIEARKEYDYANEQEFREQIGRQIKRGYAKDGNVIIPFGYSLGFTAPNGSEYLFSVDDDGALTFGIETDVAVSLASVALVASVSADVATLSSEVVAARGGEASLLARITTVNTAATNAGTAAATVQTEVTAARQGEASLTAKVTVLANATSTVDGKLNASYGITVDGGGRIASLKLLSNGSTSSIEFLATTFKVYNGTTTETPFEISGGVVKIKTANVGVLTAGNISVSTLSALSADLGTITAGQLNLTSGSYVVRHGAGFGASSDLVMWYGLASTAIGSATKTNGVFAMATDGKVYYGATELGTGAGSYDAYDSSSGHSDIRTSAGTATVTLTVTASGGTAPYTYLWTRQSASAGFSSSGTTTASLTLSKNYVVTGTDTEDWQCAVTDSVGRTLFVTAQALLGYV